MHRTVTLLLPLLLMAAERDLPAIERDTGTDKTLHALAGASLDLLCREHDAHPVVRCVLLVLVAAGKEVLDRNADHRDALATIAGASLSWQWKF